MVFHFPRAVRSFADEHRAHRMFHVSFYLAHEPPAVGGPSVLEDVLDDVVAVLVLDQYRERVRDLLQDRLLLLVDAVLQDALDHAAPICVRRQLLHLESIGVRNTPCDGSARPAGRGA